MQFYNYPVALDQLKRSDILCHELHSEKNRNLARNGKLTELEPSGECIITDI
jgi:hypothetical protein